uniref:Uncharacterized protein n=1 Tax=Tanacetum cinerariifolium TaxID=118510 RepID=A0A6L2MND6_TANCI|nr:hypothetical protein [Tanacetum cinerariifolium]
MSTQQDIYAAGFKNRPPMLNKDNYVPWSSRIIIYARSRPNGKMIADSIENGPYIRRMIATPREPDLHVLVPESFHEQIDEELTETDIKRMDVDDQAIQTILFGLPKDIYAAVDSCETGKEIWERVRQMMKENIASNLKFLNNLQPEWKRHVTIVRQTKNLHEADFTQIYEFLKMNQDENASVHNGGNQNRLVVIPGIANQSRTRNVVAARAEGTGNGNQPNATTAEDWVILLGTALSDQGEGMLLIFRLSYSLLKKKKLEFNFKLKNLISWLLQTSTSSTQHDKAPIYDTDGSAEVQLINNCYDNKIFNMFTQVEQYTDLLEPNPKPQLVPQNDNHVTSVAPSVVQSRGSVEKKFAPNEEKRTHQETIYRNLVDQVAQVNMINCNMRATNAELKSKLARYKIYEQLVEISGIEERRHMGSVGEVRECLCTTESDIFDIHSDDRNPSRANIKQALGMNFVLDEDEFNLDANTEVIVKDKGSGEKGGSTAEIVSTARPEVSTAEPKTPPITTTLFDDKYVTISNTLVKIKNQKAKEKGVAFKDANDFARPIRSITTLHPLPTIDLKDNGSKEDENRVQSRKKRAAGSSSKQKSPKKQKVNDQESIDSDKELRKCLKVLGTMKAGDVHVHKLTRLDGSYKHFSTFSRMIEVLDRQDVLDLHKIIMERFPTNDLEGYDLILWGDLKTLKESSEDDEIWRNQQDWKLLS